MQRGVLLQNRRRGMIPCRVPERRGEFLFCARDADIIEEIRARHVRRVGGEGESSGLPVERSPVLDVQEIEFLGVVIWGNRALKHERSVALQRKNPVHHPLVPVHDHAVLVPRIYAEEVVLHVVADKSHKRIGPAEILRRVCRRGVLIGPENKHIRKEQNRENKRRAGQPVFVCTERQERAGGKEDEQEGPVSFLPHCLHHHGIVRDAQHRVQHSRYHRSPEGDPGSCD